MKNVPRRRRIQVQGKQNLSSILRALKGAEKNPPPRKGLPSWSRGIDTSKAVPARVRKIWLYHKAFSILLVVIVVAGAGGLIFTQRHWILAHFLPAGSTASKAHPSDKGATARTASNVFRAKISPARPGLSKIRPSSQTGRNNRPAKRRPERQPTRRSPAAAGGIARQKPLGANLTRPPKTRMQTPKKPPGPVAHRQKTVTENRIAALPRLKNSRLTLQAIAWAHDARRRLAVINDHIVREGESVEGFTVTRINAETVIVNDGSQSWRLEFSLQP